MAESNTPREPAPQTQPMFIWPTPEHADRLFWVEKDNRLWKNEHSTWAYGDPYQEDPVTFPNHKLIYVTPEEPGRGGGNTKWSRWYYASDRIDQDEYNWEHAQADIGGTRFNTVQRTYLFPRATYDPLVPAQGDVMPNIPSGKFTSSLYVLAERQQLRTGEKEFDSLYITEKRTYVQKTSLSSTELDTQMGGSIHKTRTWYYATEVVPGTGLTAAELFADEGNAFWELQGDSMLNIGEQLTSAWYLVTSGKTVGRTSVTYSTTINYYWPAVLGEVELMDWARRNGGTDIFPRIIMAREAYRGPCKATVTRTWSASGQGVDQPTQMLPVGVAYASPFFHVNIPDCLHGEISFVCDTGSNDPDYKLNTGSTRTFDATNFTNWPASVTASDEQDQYKGGFMRTQVVVFQPS